MAVDAGCPRCSAAVPVGARFCPACGAALGDRASEERKLVTVLFADITGSTSLGERFDPERWRVLLQRFFSVMTSTIEAWGGTVQKFMGDSVMATFGVPIVREDDAERALRAACQMLERLTELNTEFKAQHGVSLAIRVGVNTGEVMAASDQNVVTGDAVNVAARLEQMAEPGTILAGERTYAAARDAFVFGEPAAREIRGKSAPVTVRQVRRPLADSLDRRKGMHVAMVGREQEVEALASLFHEAMDANSPRMALISGPPPFPLPVTAVRVTPAEMSVPQLVMNCLAPLMIQLPFRSSALVLVAPASEPASGSVRPKDHSLCPESRSGSHCCFWSSVPKSWMGAAPRHTAASSVMPTPASAREISSIARHKERKSAPAPP